MLIFVSVLRYEFYWTRKGGVLSRNGDGGYQNVSPQSCFQRSALSLLTWTVGLDWQWSEGRF